MAAELRKRRVFQPWEEPPRQLIEYTALRGVMKSGDILRFRSTCPLGRAIEFFRPGGSHAAVCWRTRIALNTGEVVTRIDMAEANARGFVPRRLSTVLAGVQGRVYYHQLPTAEPQEDVCAIEIDNMIKGDIAYNYPQLFALMFYHPRIQYREDICSEGAVRSAVKAGVIEKLDWCPTPADLVGLPGACFEIDLASVRQCIENRKAKGKAAFREPRKG
jgi:hypothetical protein